MRLIGIVLTLLLVSAASVQAQVASPRLNPLLPYIIARPNPAVQAWHEESVVGAHHLSGTAQTVLAGTPLPDANIGALLLQSRVVGDWYALSAEWFNVNSESGGTPISETATYRYDAALKFADLVTVGFGQRQENETSITPPLAPTTNLIKTFGVSMRMAEVFYVGYAQGDAKSNIDPDASLARYGLAYRSDMLRAEWFHEQVDVSPLPVPAAESDGLSVEAIFAVGLLGVEYTTTDKPATGASETTTLVHLGTMIGDHFALGIANTALSSKNPTGPDSQNINLWSATLGWIF